MANKFGEALVEEIPHAALTVTSVDHVLPVKEIAARLVELPVQAVRKEERSGMASEEEPAL